MKKYVSLYVHIPFCVVKCKYCDFLSFDGESYGTMLRYVDCLCQEIKMYAPIVADYGVRSIFIGGGTPSLLDESLITNIMAFIRRYFHVEKNAEVTIEANPGTLRHQKLNGYKAAGINRISIGLQSCDDDMLKKLGRIHNFDQFVASYNAARRAGFQNINIDIMSGLPGQTIHTYVDTLSRVIEFGSEHISAYSLSIEEGTPFAKDPQILSELPPEMVDRRMYEITKQLLAAHGYDRYEFSNYAKPGYECRHNIGYWKRVDYLGVGLGASSLIDNVRYSNTRDLYTYLSECENIHDCYMQYPLTEGVTGSAVYSADGTHILVPAVNLHAAAEQTTRNEQMEEFMFLGLRMRDGFYREEFTQAFGIPIEAVYGDALNHLQQEELLLKREGRIYLTDKGMDLNNYVVAQFML